ncbi:MAG: type II toxin-antitoxin system RelE/ParE family toxin [Nanoarchaeota archaeon]|nr:type II toxin-antitoxin system RelE/ParE family toxin [Nanoarchaeota archaeon]
MNIVIQPRAKKDLKKLSAEIIETILRKIMLIQDDTLRYIERLKGSPLWKLRIGDYRAILLVSTQEKVINVIKIGYRKNRYKQ